MYANIILFKRKTGMNTVLYSRSVTQLSLQLYKIIFRK